LKQKKRKKSVRASTIQGERTRAPKQNKKILFVRIVAGVIAFLMIISVLFSVVGT
jgi:hypothetical protein